MYFDLQLDKEDIKAVEVAFKGMESKTPARLKNAINRTVTATMKAVKSSVLKTYTIKPARYKEAQQTVYRATVSNLGASIRVKDEEPTLGNYKITRGKKSGIRATELKGEDVKALEVKDWMSKAFIPTAGKANGLVTQRRIAHVGPKDGHFKVLHGTSVPKMMEQAWNGKTGSQGKLSEEMQKRLHQEIDREIERIITGS